MENEVEFLKEYDLLCEKYGLYITVYDEDSLCVVSKDDRYCPIYTSEKISEFHRMRKQSEIRDRKRYWESLDIPTDDDGHPLKFEGPQLPPQNYEPISWSINGVEQGRWVPYKKEDENV